MTTLAELCLACVLAGCLMVLGILLTGRLFSPLGRAGSVYAVLRASGDGEALEHELKGLNWARSLGLSGFEILVVDVGLDETGWRRLELLRRRYGEFRVCGAQELRDYFM